MIRGDPSLLCLCEGHRSGISSSSDIAGHLVLFVDNEVVRFILTKGQSHSRNLFVKMKQAFALIDRLGLILSVLRVPSDKNPADSLTRSGNFSAADYSQMEQCIYNGTVFDLVGHWEDAGGEGQGSRNFHQQMY